MQKRLPTEQAFETSDLYLASFLLTRGLRLWATDRRDPDRVAFVLTPRPTPDDLAAYAEGRAVVNVSEFGRALRKLKHAIYNGGEGGGR